MTSLGGDRPIRVLLWHWGRRGGGPHYTLKLARALATRTDLNIHLSLSRQSELYRAFDGLAEDRRFDLDTYTNLPGFGFRSLALPFLRRRFAAYLRREQIDVVFCTMDHLWNSFMVGTIRPAGALYLLAVHDAVRHSGEDQALRQWLLRRDVAAADGCLALTESVRELLIAHHRFPPERCWVAPHGVFSYGTEPTVRVLPTDRPVRLLFFGRLLPYKGLDLLLDSLPLIRARGHDICLEIWGSGNLATYTDRLSGLDRNRIRVENRWIAETDIPAILERADLCILPYREASQSGVIPTAFAAGLPVVITPVAGLLEQIKDGDNAVAANGFDAAALATAVHKVLDSPRLYEHLSRGALETAATELDWATIGDKVANAIHALNAIGERDRTKQAE